MNNKVFLIQAPKGLQRIEKSIRRIHILQGQSRAETEVDVEAMQDDDPPREFKEEEAQEAIDLDKATGHHMIPKTPD